MASDTPQNYKASGQQPLDSKIIFKSKEIFFTYIETKPFYAFDFYKGLIIYFQLEETFYIWENPFSKSFNQNNKLLSENFIYPDGSVYAGLDYSGVAYNLIEYSYNIENLGSWSASDNTNTIIIEINQGQSNFFNSQQILDIFPSADRFIFTSGEISGITFLDEPIEFDKIYSLADWNSFNYSEFTGLQFTQFAKMQILMTGEIYLPLEKEGNSFKNLKIIYDISDAVDKNSMYFLPIENDDENFPADQTFAIYLIDKNQVKRKLFSSGSGSGNSFSVDLNGTDLEFKNLQDNIFETVSLTALSGNDGESVSAIYMADEASAITASLANPNNIYYW